jgi:hypothetical protein
MKPTIRTMRIREAKDFLVTQTAEQAALEGVPLSDLEKRMMHFTEDQDASEDPTALNEEFEAQYETAKYEKKISRLMRHAYKRIRTENSEKVLKWNRAIRTLRRGDHYILVLWGHPLSHGSPRDWAIFLAIGLPVAAYCLFGFFFFPRRNGSWPYSNYIPHVNPHVMQVLFLSLIIVAIFFPQLLLRPTDWWFSLFDRLIDPQKPDGKAE